MASAFFTRFLLMIAAMAAVFAGLGYATWALMFQTPPERFYVRGTSFEVPQGWECHVESTEVVCAPPKIPNDAIVIATSKTAARDDNLAAYRVHLEQPRPVPGRPSTFSEVVSVRNVIYGGREWVDALHRNSEVWHYDTRYFATVIEASAVLITFSCHRDYCSGYQATLERFVSSVAPRGTDGF